MTDDAGQGWHLYRGTGEPHDGIATVPPPPPWRRFATGPAEPGQPDPVRPVMGPGRSQRPAAEARAASYRPDPEVVDVVNAAIYLRRPLLITGKPGTGKSTLAFSIAFELQLGPVLSWPVTSRSTLGDALYRYDAIGRLQETNLYRDRLGEVPDIGKFLRLGPLGTALLPWERPRVLLIDELDKSDLDLPNDLLNVFEEGWFDLPELARLPPEQQPVTVTTDDGGRAVIDAGRVACAEFPITIITSNGERDFPPAFRRRCLSLYIKPPDDDRLRAIVAAQLGPDTLAEYEGLVRHFLGQRDVRDLSTDQLLNLIHLASTGQVSSAAERTRLAELILQPINVEALGVRSTPRPGLRAFGRPLPPRSPPEVALCP